MNLCSFPYDSCIRYKGLQDPTRSRYDLFLRTITIITAVVPPELPMQLAIATNAAVLVLMDRNIFCTKPSRLAVSGSTTTCLFDKTGTLTSDQIRAVGVVEAVDVLGKSGNASHVGRVENTSAAGGEGGEEEEGSRPHDSVGGTSDGVVGSSVGVNRDERIVAPASLASRRTARRRLRPLLEASMDVQVILSTCHSLVATFDGSTIGDPMEQAALDAVGWSYSNGCAWKNGAGLFAGIAQRRGLGWMGAPVRPFWEIK